MLWESHEACGIVGRHAKVAKVRQLSNISEPQILAVVLAGGMEALDAVRAASIVIWCVCVCAAGLVILHGFLAHVWFHHFTVRE